MRAFHNFSNLEVHFTDEADPFKGNALYNVYLRWYTKNLLNRHVYCDDLFDLVLRFVDDKVKLGKELSSLVDTGAPGGKSLYEKMSPLELDLRGSLGDEEDNIKKIISAAEEKGQRDAVYQVLDGYIKYPKERPGDISTIPSYTHAAKAFELDEIDLNILLFLEISDKIHDLSTLTQHWKNKEFIKGMAIACDYPLEVFQKHLTPQSTLVKLGLIESSANSSFSFFDVSDAFKDSFVYDGNAALFENCFTVNKGPILELDTFPVDKNSRNLCKILLGAPEPVHILLHGTEGTGKTEFARSLVAATGQKALFLDRDAVKNDKTLFRLELGAHGIVKGTSVIIVDEAEDFLAPSEGKSRINIAMEYMKASVIWIVNNIGAIPPSTRRRFMYSIEFKPLSAKRIKLLVENKLQGLQISQEAKTRIVDLAGYMGLNASTTAKLYTTLSALDPASKNDEEIVEYSSTLLLANRQLLKGDPIRLKKNYSNYSIHALNLSVPADRILGNLKNAVVQMEQGPVRDSGGFRMLFHGAPGTGKSQLGHYLADQMDRRLDIRRFSDIVDAFVGNTEKNIAQMFSDAEASGSILLIDEIESLMYDRGRAKQSWELSQVDEFLTRLDEFNGILICTTNYLSILDKAVLRRFHQKVEFFPLDESGLRSLLEVYFPAHAFSDAEILKLVACGPFVPGDFMVCKRAVELEGDASSKAYIMEVLIEEAQQRKVEKAIGFSA